MTPLLSFFVPNPSTGAKRSIDTDHVAEQTSDYGTTWTAISDWLPPLLATITFLAHGLCKVYGWSNGVIGGGGKLRRCRLRGQCPRWSNQFNFAFYDPASRDRITEWCVVRPYSSGHNLAGRNFHLPSRYYLFSFGLAFSIRPANVPPWSPCCQVPA